VTLTIPEGLTGVFANASPRFSFGRPAVAAKLLRLAGSGDRCMCHSRVSFAARVGCLSLLALLCACGTGTEPQTAPHQGGTSGTAAATPSGGTLGTGGASALLGGASGEAMTSGGVASGAGAANVAGSAGIGAVADRGGAAGIAGAGEPGGAPPTTAGTASTSIAGKGGGSAVMGGATSTSTGGNAAQGGNAQGGSAATGGVSSTAGMTHSAGTETGGAPTTGGAPPIAGAPSMPPSCQGLTTLCQGESCCTTIKVPGGTFPMGRSEDTNASDYYTSANGDELPEHQATVADFALDKYEVTVGRFRKFVSAYNKWHKATTPNPQVGAGVNPTVDMVNRAATGWGGSWTPSSSDLPADSNTLIEALKAESSRQTWTDTATTNEAYPINFVTWYVAFAFCIWDGGWLPTEAQWEYAAAGGAQNVLYPWGSAKPDPNLANYYPDGLPFVDVGSKLATGGAGIFGHSDLAGSMGEWVFDWYATSYYGSPTSPAICDNCANTTPATYRSSRGFSWASDYDHLRAAARNVMVPAGRGNSTGIRCARSAT
jgi:formylglycine-generating enzyme